MYVIGLDIGGTKIEGAVVDSKGKTHLKKRLKTEVHKGKKQVLKNIKSVIEYLLKNSNKRIKRIGVAIPGFADSSGKIVFTGPNIKPLFNINLKKELKSYKLPLVIENDANCFALAESLYGAGKKHRVVLGIIWGTGVGLGIVINKKIFSGSIGGAGEFGHTILNPETKYGTVELLSSGKNIVRIYKNKKGKIKNPSAKDISDSKEKIAKKVINNAVHYLGLGLANLTNLFNPDIIVIGGGISNLPNKFYLQLKKEVKKHAIPALTKNLIITKYKLLHNSGMLGAASLVLKR